TGLLFLLIDRSPWGYFYTYWIGLIFSFALGFAVIFEILGHVLRPYDALWSLGSKLFFGLGALLIVAGVVSLAGTSTALDYNALMAWIHVTERGLRMVQCGLLAFLVLFSTYFGITWRHHLFGIALGLGVYASVELAATAARSEVGWIGHETYNVVRLMASACATLIWAAYLLRPEPASLRAERVPRHPVEEWNRALQELWQR
ncbi:MAG: hypothetical protein ACRESV_09620, partial [Nevskiales bacterium]